MGHFVISCNSVWYLLPGCLPARFYHFCLNRTVNYFHPTVFIAVTLHIILPKMAITTYNEQMSENIIIVSIHKKCLSRVVLWLHALFLSLFLYFVPTCSCDLAVCGSGRCGSDPGNHLLRQVSLNTWIHMWSWNWSFCCRVNSLNQINTTRRPIWGLNAFKLIKTTLCFHIFAIN